MNHHLNGMIDFAEQKWQQHGKASNLSLQEAGCLATVPVSAADTWISTFPPLCKTYLE
jgi:hypothetical protein